MEIEDIKKEYDKKKLKYEKLKNEIQYIIETKLAEKDIPLHQISSRVKPIESFIEKAKREDIKKPFEEIEDICGLRIICLFISDLHKIGEIIEESLEIQKKDDKIYSEPDAFGYLSVHYIGTLPEYYSGPRYDDLKGLKFEIQLRTIAMHAWATISRYLVYKSSLAIPTHLRKDFNALSALFYIADEHFENFFKASEEAKQMAEKASKPKLETEEINFNTLKAYMQSKYKDRNHNENPEHISKLVDEIRNSGYKTIKQIDDILIRSEKAFEAYEKDVLADSSLPEPYWDVGVIRISLSIADETYLNNSTYDNEEKERKRKYRKLINQTS